MLLHVTLLPEEQLNLTRLSQQTTCNTYDDIVEGAILFYAQAWCIKQLEGRLGFRNHASGEQIELLIPSYPSMFAMAAGQQETSHVFEISSLGETLLEWLLNTDCFPDYPTAAKCTLNTYGRVLQQLTSGSHWQYGALTKANEFVPLLIPHLLSREN